VTIEWDGGASPRSRGTRVLDIGGLHGELLRYHLFDTKLHNRVEPRKSIILPHGQLPSIGLDADPGPVARTLAAFPSRGDGYGKVHSHGFAHAQDVAG
jgi:hypothetical protein